MGMDACSRRREFQAMTHPNTDQGVTAEDRAALEAIDDALGFLMDNERAIVLDAFRAHRLSSTAALEAEIASLKARLESAEGYLADMLKAMRNEGVCDDTCISCEAVRTFLQEQEKQNG